MGPVLKVAFSFEMLAILLQTVILLLDELIHAIDTIECGFDIALD